MVSDETIVRFLWFTMFSDETYSLQTQFVMYSFVADIFELHRESQVVALDISKACIAHYSSELIQLRASYLTGLILSLVKVKMSTSIRSIMVFL